MQILVLILSTVDCRCGAQRIVLTAHAAPLTYGLPGQLKARCCFRDCAPSIPWPVNPTIIESGAVAVTILLELGVEIISTQVGHYIHQWRKYGSG